MQRDDRRRFFASKLAIYRADPVRFFVEILHFSPDPWQQDAARDLASSRRVTIRSGQGVGKTAFEAACILWFLTCFPYPRIVATAPTRQQLNDVLWSEVAKWMERSPLLRKMLKWTKTYIYVVGYEKRWFAVARTATKPENMQGFHEDNMLFVVDEASGVADPIMEAILGTLSGSNNKLLMCGNPTRLSGVFYESHERDRANYKVHKVSSRDSPRTSRENIKSLEQKYGKDSNVVRVRVDGEFPKQEDDVLIPISLAEAARMIEIAEEATFIELGVDVARYGDDETVIAPKVGGVVRNLIIRRGQSLMETVGGILKTCHELRDEFQYTGKVAVKIDDTGLGGGVTDRLREIREEERLDWLVVAPINFSQSAKSRYYDDITTLMWAKVKDAMEDKTVRIPNDEELIAQFSCRKYSMRSNGKIRLESKDDMKKRGIKSPDRADAVALACLPVKIR